MIEIISKRGENSKTFDIGGGKLRLEIGGGHSHYKDNYADANEQWKDVDLTIKDGKVTKAPYELTIDGNAYHIRDKKTGKESTVELLKVGDTVISKEDLTAVKSAEIIPNVDYELVLSACQIKFQRTIKDADALKTAEFKIGGDIPVTYHAEDADGDPIEVITEETKDGIIESFAVEKTVLVADKDEKLVESKVAVKYPIKIDPTLTIQGGSDDNTLSGAFPDNNYATNERITISGPVTNRRTGLIRMSLGLPEGAVITTATLSLYYMFWQTSDPVTETVYVYKIRRADWVASEATYNIYKTSNNWGTAGCQNTTTDIDTSVSASQVIPAGYGWVDWDVKTICENAVTNSLNFNVRISMENDNIAHFHSNENTSDTAKRPKLVIEYHYLPAFLNYYQNIMR